MMPEGFALTVSIFLFVAAGFLGGFGVDLVFGGHHYVALGSMLIGLAIGAFGLALVFLSYEAVMTIMKQP